MLAERPRLKSALSWLVPATVFLVIVMAVFWRLWTGIDGARRAFGWDAQWEYWGDLQFLHDSFAAGELPLWNPFDRGGYPLHADPQAGVLYPINWILVGLSFLTGPVWWLVTIKIVLHFWIAAFGTYVFLRRRRLPEAACYAGGIFLILSYPFSHAMFSALNWGMAWAPWMLLAVDWWSEKPTPGRAGGVALAFGISQLTGAPAAFWYALIVVVPYGTWAIAHHARASGDPRAYLKRAAVTTAIAGGLFVAMVAAQLHATSEMVTHTIRDARDLDFVGTTAFTGEDLMAFMVHGMPAPSEAPYITIVLLFATATLLSVEPTARRLVLTGAAVMGVLCAMGNLAGFLPFSASLVPPFGFFRRAHRYLYVTMLPLSILGAEGLALLARTELAAARRRYGWVLIGAGALGLLVFGIGYVVTAPKGKEAEGIRDAYAWTVAAFVVSTWALHQLVTREGRWKQIFLAVAVVVLGVDLWHARAPIVEKNFYPIPTVPRDKLAGELAGVPLEARVYDREVLRFRPGIRLGIRDLGGYEGDPLALARYARLLKMVQANPLLLGHANVRWLLEEGKTTTKPNVLTKTGLTVRYAGAWEVPQVAPAVMWIDAATIVDGGEQQALDALKNATPGTVAVLERGTLHGDEAARASDGGVLPSATGRIVSYGRSRLTAEIDAPAAGVVVIHESYYPGWRARVDGQPAHIVPANGLFRGVLVGPGPHHIEMEYPATAYRVLAPLSLLGLVAALALLWRERRRDRRDAAAAPAPPSEASAS